MFRGARKTHPPKSGSFQPFPVHEGPHLGQANENENAAVTEEFSMEISPDVTHYSSRVMLRSICDPYHYQYRQNPNF